MAETRIWTPRRALAGRRETRNGEIVRKAQDQAAVEVMKALMQAENLVGKASPNGGGVPPGSSWYNAGGPNNSLAARVSNNLAAAFGRPPEDVEQALATQGLSWSAPFGPGRPLDPYFGYRRPVRTFDYTVGENVQVVPRWGRISFQTLKAMIDNCEIATIVIRHLINDIRTLSYAFMPPEGTREDVSEDLEKARAFFAMPDRRQPFRAWLAEYLQDVLRYDAGALYIRRNNSGEPIALEVASGPTFVKLVDFFGRTPTDENDATAEPEGEFTGKTVPAYLQIIQGMPWDWLAADDLIYQPWNPLPDSQYGLAPMESVLISANADVRFQWHWLQYFTEGSIPAGFMEAPPDLSDPAQVAEWQDTWDALMLGDQAKLRQIRWVPAGAKFTAVKSSDFDSNFPLYIMRRIASAFGVNLNDLGYTETTNRSTSESQIDIQWRVGTMPLVRHVEDVINMFLREHLKLRAEIRFDKGQEAEDRLSLAQAHDIYVKNGTIGVDEVRAEIGRPVNRERPTPRYVFTTRNGPIPLLAIESLAGDTDPETFAPPVDTPLVPHPFVITPGVIPEMGTPEYKADADSSANMQREMLAQASGISPEQAGIGDAVPKSVAGTPAEPPTKVAVTDTRPVSGAESAASKALSEAMSVIETLVDRLGLDDVSKGKKNKTEFNGIKAAGIALVAADTGRVLLQQRALKDDTKDAAGYFELPGGCLEDDETPWEAALREWGEEVGVDLLAACPDAELIGILPSDDGDYVAYVVSVPSEDLIPVNVRFADSAGV